MEILHALAAQQAREMLVREFGTPEWQHRAAALAAHEPQRRRFMRQVRRLKLLAGRSSTPVAAPG
ncbi:MAG TPA: hypothetical protein VFY84_08095, partial [Jiangellales bacterium]|nr:hypothetical protein [Jiangellales bacterium]